LSPSTVPETAPTQRPRVSLELPAPFVRIFIVFLYLAAIAQAAFVIAPVIGHSIPFGGDLDIYLGATQRFLAGGSFYPPEQLAGPYQIATGVILYPPTTVPLFAAFTVLPRILWWAVPIGITACVVVRFRPSAFGWAIIAVCLTYANSIGLLVHGNPAIWVSAALALATFDRWVAAFVLLKPSLAPLAAIGIRDVRWWLVVAVPAIASLALLPLWHDYLVSLTNLRGAGIDYSLGDVPLVIVPLVAWATRRHG